MFKGYLSLGGNEIGNTARVFAYVRNSGAGIPLRNCDDCGDLAEAIGDEAYSSPIVDGAPWFDPNRPETARFYGFYPTDIQGMEDSTREASVTQSVGDGGSVGATRYGTRTIRVKGVLLAADELAMSAGMTWLSRALDGNDCAGGGCDGGPLCYWAACPEICDIYEDEFSASDVLPITGETTESTPLIMRYVGFQRYMWRGTFVPEMNPDGVIIRYGAVSLEDGSQWVEQHGPVVLRRVNRIANSFLRPNDLDDWEPAGVGSLFLENGGPAGTHFMRLVAAPDETMGARALGTSIITSAQTILSFDYRSIGTEPLTVRLLDVDDNLLHTDSFTPGAEWRRVNSILPTTGTVAFVEFLTDGDADLARIVLESGQTPLPPFDAETPVDEAMVGYRTQEIDPEYAASWLGTPQGSASQIDWLGDAIVGAPMATAFEPWNMSAICRAYPRLDVLQGIFTGVLGVAYRFPISPEKQLLQYERTMYSVAATSGPTEIGTRKFSSGALIREVDFVLEAGNPFSYGPEKELLPRTKMIDLPTQPWTDPDCTVPDPAPVIDPDCPPVPAPPKPPSITNSCVTPETQWQRYWLEIPEESVSLWSATSPKIVISSGAEEIRQVRVRVFPNPFRRRVTPGRTNLHPNPRLYQFSNGWSTGGSGGTAGVGTYSRVAAGGPTAEIVAFARNTSGGVASGTAFGLSYDRIAGGLAIPIAPNKTYRISGYSRISTGTIAAMDLRADYLNNALANVGVSSVGAVTFEAGGTTWRRWSIIVTATPAGPSGDTMSRMKLSLYNAVSPGAAGVTFDTTGMLIEEVEPGAPVASPSYFDGSTPDAAGWYYQWSGAVGESISTASKAPLDPCSWCSEFVVSYLPAQTELTVDAIMQNSTLRVAGGPEQSAGHLLYAADGSPIQWPELSCGMEYLMAIDVPEPLLDDVTVAITASTRE